MLRFRSGSMLGLALVLASGSGVAADGAAPAAGAPVVSSQAGNAVDARLLELLNRIDQLEQELRQLRGNVEMMGHDLDGVKRRQRDLYLDVDRRLRDLEVGGARSSAPAAAPQQEAAAAATTGTNAGSAAAAPSSASAQQPAPAPALPSAAERKAYQHAFDLLKEGNYPQAIAAFESFLKAYPKSAYADNAQYWLGEASYVSRDYKKALAEFSKVGAVYPNSPKVADAQLKIGFTRYEMGQWAQARSVLQDVLKRYPNTSAARLAATRLQRMSQEGH